MGLILRQRGVVARSTLGALGLASVLLVGGCKEIEDIGEEMGWIERREAPAPAAPTASSLDAHWVPADAAVDGTSQVEWSMRWWQWTAKFPRDQLPFRDPDGRWCAEHQDGAVWFLAGTDGNADAVRSCKIPADKHLFIPVIAYLQSSSGLQGRQLDCTQMKQAAAEIPEHVLSGLILLDGRPIGELQRMRAASGKCFALDGRTAASDGFWLMLKPLPPGKHTLAVAANYRNGPKEGMQNFQYTLEVEGPAASKATAAGESAGAPP